MAKLPLPPARILPWGLKPLSSAKTDLTYDRYGRMVMTIEHDLLKGVTPRMVEWWFRNIGGQMEIGVERLDNYLVWHPFDHIRWELAAPAPGGGAGKGAKFRIVEMFNANPDFYIDVVEEVIRLDETGITLVNRTPGFEITRLNHDFIAAEGGTIYRSTLTIGAAVPIVCNIVNPLFRRFVFTEAMGYAWLRHNVEEVGALEHILPRTWPA